MRKTLPKISKQDQQDLENIPLKESLPVDCGVNVPLKIVDDEYLFRIPRKIAKCGYCGAQLTGYAMAWEEQDDGLYLITELEFECSKMPSFERPKKWNEWYSYHKDSPYIYQLPENEKAERWVKENFRVKMKAH